MTGLFDVSGKRVVVTGGSQGIGAMIARGYAAAGARVALVARDAERVGATAAEIRAEGGQAEAHAFDLSRLDGVRALVAALEADEAPLDILINNAGATWGAPLDEFPEQGWDRTMNLNLKAPFFLIQGLLPALRRASRPGAPARVINVGSADGLRPPTFDSYAYSASKSGLFMLTRHLAKRLAAENILVNAIAPGPFLTKMMAGTLAKQEEEIRAAVPLGRLGLADDIAGVAIFLGAPASAYLTGAIIPCDGGLSAV